ncbi:MBL fold metallo-hydrolase [Afifella sp. JA880]|uniref:MBL fold metallo-hydrolase n=1 Tax=Afifella sp. JA880 TaxID=2975280 RepID=UPI0021BB9428|nr:MBL fold metallo-hydrolase [Afifella sp. JA880]MCT8265851.1 MBL fold metallo-hydrolase [Afifella sp. JA880]
MTDVLRITILGCGSSPGVPRIGGDWGACDPSEPKNRRRRCSVLVERVTASGEKTQVLIDTSPDLREQALSADLKRIDGVLYTHPHADHIHGIDDLRGFVMMMKARVDIYADRPTMDRLEEGFGYCLKTPEGSDYPPIVNPHLIEPGTPVTIDGAGGPIHALPFRQQHGSIPSLGYRIGNFAYSPDVNRLTPEAMAAIDGAELWIVDALRYKPHPSHFSVEEALHCIETLRPRRALLTHMHVDLDYNALRERLPEGVEPAFDGLVVELPWVELSSRPAS